MLLSWFDMFYVVQIQSQCLAILYTTYYNTQLKHSVKVHFCGCFGININYSKGRNLVFSATYSKYLWNCIVPCWLTCCFRKNRGNHSTFSTILLVEKVGRLYSMVFSSQSWWHHWQYKGKMILHQQFKCVESAKIMIIWFLNISSVITIVSRINKTPL